MASVLGSLLGLLAFNVALKLAGFAATVALTRRVAPTVKGVDFVVEMYASVAVFLAREAVRSTALRTASLHTLAELRRVVAIAWLCPCVAVATGVVVGYFLAFRSTIPLSPLETSWLAGRDGDDTSVIFLMKTQQATLCLFALGIFFEALSEPFQAPLLAAGRLRPKVVIEAVALLVRVGTVHAALSHCGHRGAEWLARTFLLDGGPASTNSFFSSLSERAAARGEAPSHVSLCTLTHSGGATTTLLFALAQAAFGMAIVVGFVAWGTVATFSLSPLGGDEKSESSADMAHHPQASRRRLLPVVVETLGVTEAPIKEIRSSGGWYVGREWRRSLPWLSSFMAEGTVRLGLTEGEKYVLSACVPLHDVGVYDAVNRIGALAARLIFRVWEEYAFSRWSRAAAAAAEEEENNAIKKAGRDVVANNGENSSAVSSNAKSEAIVTTALRPMLPLAVFFGAASAAFGPPLSATVLALLYGRAWATPEATSVLQAYCLGSLPLMAVNGLLEAFVRATVVDAKGTARVKAGLVVCSLASVACLYVCVVMLKKGDDPSLRQDETSGQVSMSLRFVYCGMVNFALRVLLSLVVIAWWCRRKESDDNTKNGGSVSALLRRVASVAAAIVPPWQQLACVAAGGALVRGGGWLWGGVEEGGALQHPVGIVVVGIASVVAAVATSGAAFWRGV